MRSSRSILGRYGVKAMLFIKEHIESRIVYQFCFYCFISFIIAITFFGILQYTSHQFVERYYSQSEIVAHHYREKIADIQHYILEHDISSTEMYKLNGLIQSEELLTLAIYTDQLIYSSNEMTHLNLSDSFSSTPWESHYLLSLSDRDASVSMLYQFKHIYKDYATYLNMTLFFLINMWIPLLFIKKKVVALLLLNKEVNTLKTGDLKCHMTYKGRDELAMLSDNIDTLRSVLIKKELDSQRTQAAHNELVANISHDLRTPLTTLSGYIDILAMDDTIGDARKRVYLSKCKTKTTQLKTLIDELFQYFFVSSKPSDEIKLTTYSTTKQVDSLILNELDLLVSKGFDIHSHLTTEYKSLSIDLRLIQRLVDNLMTNIMKYGDPESPIMLTNYSDQDILVIKITNKIRPNPSTSERNGLGLRICAKIMSLHNGFFHTSVEEDVFITCIEFRA